MNGEDRRDIARGISMILQVGLTVIVPLVLFILLGVRLKETVGAWCMLPCIFLGLAGGAAGAWKLLKKTEHAMKQEEQEQYDLMAEWHRPEEEEKPHEK